MRVWRLDWLCVLFQQHQEKATGQGDTTIYGPKKAEMDWIWNIYELNSCCKARLQSVLCTYNCMQSYEYIETYWNISTSNLYILLKRILETN